MDTPILKTKRLTLRPINLMDAPAVQKYFNDWDIIKHMSVAVPYPYPYDGAIYLHDEAAKHHSGDIAEVWEITKDSWAARKTS